MPEAALYPIYARLFLHMHVCVHVCIYMCMCVYMHICTSVCMCVHVCECAPSSSIIEKSLELLKIRDCCRRHMKLAA